MNQLTPQDLSTRDQILLACDRLFYGLGLRSVSLDQVAKASQLTKRTLYYHFKSKDALIEAWLTQRADLARIATAAIQGSPLERLRIAFGQLEPMVEHPHYRGCPFVNAVAELADPKHPAFAVAQRYKADRLAWFQSITDELGKPAALSDALMILWEGALARAVISRSRLSVQEALNAAQLLLR